MRRETDSVRAPYHVLIDEPLLERPPLDLSAPAAQRLTPLPPHARHNAAEAPPAHARTVAHVMRPAGQPVCGAARSLAARDNCLAGWPCVCLRRSLRTFARSPEHTRERRGTAPLLYLVTPVRPPGHTPPPHLHRDWARRCHICTRTGLPPSAYCMA